MPGPPWGPALGKGAGSATEGLPERKRPTCLFTPASPPPPPSSSRAVPRAEALGAGPSSDGRGLSELAASRSISVAPVAPEAFDVLVDDAPFVPTTAPPSLSLRPEPPLAFLTSSVVAKPRPGCGARGPRLGARVWGVFFLGTPRTPSRAVSNVKSSVCLFWFVFVVCPLVSLSRETSSASNRGGLRAWGFVGVLFRFCKNEENHVDTLIHYVISKFIN